MIILEKILGFTSDPKYEKLIHDLSHENKIDYIILDPTDVPRKRIRIKSDKGIDCAISLNRNENLSNGAILFISDEKAIIIKIKRQKWIEIKVNSIKDTIRFGYFIGNLHWKVKFKDENVLIALEGPLNNYKDRIKDFINTNQISIIGETYD